MGQRIPTRDLPAGEELESYVRDVLSTLIRLAQDAEMPDLADRIRAAKGHLDQDPPVKPE